MARSRLLRYGVPILAAAAKYASRGFGDAVRSKAKSAASYGLSSVGRYARRAARGKRSGSYRFKSTRPVTQQHDVRAALTRQRGGKSWSRFRSKVRAALQADNPRHLYQAVYKNAASATDSIAGFGGTFFLDLNTTAQGDIFNVFKDAYATTSTDIDNYKLYVKSAQVDFMLKNTHATNPLEVDLYECVARRDDSQAGDVNTIWNTYFSDMDAIGTVSSSHPAMTPYHVPNFIRSWKVIKSTKFMVDPGKSISTQQRASLNRVMSGLKISQGVSVQKGLTRMFLFRVRGVPENATATGSLPPSGLGAWSIAWSQLTSISYQPMPTGDQTEDIDQSK